MTKELRLVAMDISVGVTIEPTKNQAEITFYRCELPYKGRYVQLPHAYVLRTEFGRVMDNLINALVRELLQEEFRYGRMPTYTVSTNTTTTSSYFSGNGNSWTLLPRR